MSILLVDAETYSDVDLKEVGSYIYAAHPSTRVLLWSLRDLDWEAPLVFEEPNLWKLLKLLKDTNRIRWTKNEPLDIVSWGIFDRLIVQHSPTISDHRDSQWLDKEIDGAIVGPNNTQWADLMEFSLIHGGPAELSAATAFWAPKFRPKKKRQDLITRFCSPDSKTGKQVTQDKDPIRWAEFVAYASYDTECIVAVIDKMMSYQDPDFIMGEDADKHWSGSSVIRRMNERGMPIDRGSVVIAKTMIEVKEASVIDPFVAEFGFSPTSVKSVTEYLGTENSQKDTLEELLLDPRTPDDKRTVAEARLLVSGAARKKLTPMLRMTTDEDPFAKGIFVYHGPHTRRLSSRGIQGQNFVRHKSDEGFFRKLSSAKARKHLNILEDTRNNIRGFVQAPDGYTFVAADYSAIECRGAAWLAGEEWLLKAFENDEDPYLVMASDIYKTDVSDPEDPRRQFGKVVVLGCQYQLGWYGLIMQALSRGLVITEKEAKDAVNTYREKNAAIVAAWKVCDKAMRDLIHFDPSEYLVWDQVRFERHKDFIKVVRPSGFGQYFWYPKLRKGSWPDGGPKVEIGFTGKGKSGRMQNKSTYGGDVFQGITQGVAADFMIEGMERVEEEFPPVMSIHDEVVSIVPDDGVNRVKRLCDQLCVRPKWAKDYPIKATGWTGRRFTK